jgi:nitrate reductase assembly molybdenum cofactor insertion protein NarJ
MDSAGGARGKPMTAAIDSRMRELLSEAAEWRLLSLLFDCPSPSWSVHMEQLSKEVSDPQLRKCASLALEQASEGLYHSTFGPGGPAPPREVSYSNTLQFGSLMSELESYYGAFGYHPPAREAPDHIAIETGFLAFLKMKEAFAHASGDDEHAAVTAEAADRFVADHLSRLARPLAERLALSGLVFLVEAARALCNRVGPVPAPVTPLRDEGLRVLNGESVFACGPDTGDEGETAILEF